MVVGLSLVGIMEYFVIDSVEALSKFGTDVWEHVVCVMTTGHLGYCVYYCILVLTFFRQLM